MTPQTLSGFGQTNHNPIPAMLSAQAGKQIVENIAKGSESVVVIENVGHSQAISFANHSEGTTAQCLNPRLPENFGPKCRKR